MCALAETSSDDASSDGRLYRRAVSHTRALVVAEALLAIMIGFTADDLGLLRVPGYLAGLAAALALIVGGGLFHGYRLTKRLETEDPDTIDARLTSYQTRGRLAAIVVALLFIAWAVFFTQGVPPWAL